ncbi:sensor histidine kinase [Massilia sp. Leaf139]|uniref:sensor histidine kinase n=1 Tax=Massilia sp. Leaf139 TaxID=1736272 RepID=UPI0006FED580|nr:ATP-binding protein [Massilia sp. Leaf139]KQQ97390.1 hypothetical protein ASF77_05440 [Massilia sp. Leaf139]
MKTAGHLPAIVLLLGCAACAAGAALPPSPPLQPGLSTLPTILWLLGAGGAICMLLKRSIDADDRGRELALRLAREQQARRGVEEILADTQTVLSKVVHQQESVRDAERSRMARDIDDRLGQALLTLRVELCLMQAASNGVQPTVHAKTGGMIGTLDLALGALRAVVAELRPLALGEGLASAVARQLDEFTRINGIAHQLELPAGPADEPERADCESDALLYRVLQEALAGLAYQANATEVRVGLQRSGSALTLRVDDNGRGSRRPGGACGCGLAAMRERVEACGGALRITAKSDGGSALSLTLPRVRGLAAA